MVYRLINEGYLKEVMSLFCFVRRFIMTLIIKEYFPTQKKEKKK